MFKFIKKNREESSLNSRFFFFSELTAKNRKKYFNVPDCIYSINRHWAIKD